MRTFRKNILVFIGFLSFFISCKSQVDQKKELIELKISVFNGVGGTNFQEKPSILKVFNAGNTQAIFSKKLSNGEVFVHLEKDKSYDFELEGCTEGVEKLAGSKLLNHYIGSEVKQTLTMFQFSLGMITRGITPPDIVFVKDKATGRVITEDFEITDDVKTLIVEFSSVVGGVEPVALSGFGAKIAFDSVPNFSNGIVGSFFEPVYNNGVFTSHWEFNIDKESIKFPQGKTKLVIVGYDVANNRVEKHINVRYAKTSDSLFFWKWYLF